MAQKEVPQRRVGEIVWREPGEIIPGESFCKEVAAILSELKMQPGRWAAILQSQDREVIRRAVNRLKKRYVLFEFQSRTELRPSNAVGNKVGVLFAKFRG